MWSGTSRIIGMREENGKKDFLVLWKGLSRGKSWWVPAEHVDYGDRLDVRLPPLFSCNKIFPIDPKNLFLFSKGIPQSFKEKKTGND